MAEGGNEDYALVVGLRLKDELSKNLETLEKKLKKFQETADKVGKNEVGTQKIIESSVKIQEKALQNAELIRKKMVQHGINEAKSYSIVGALTQKIHKLNEEISNVKVQISQTIDKSSKNQLNGELEALKLTKMKYSVQKEQMQFIEVQTQKEWSIRRKIWSDQDKAQRQADIAAKAAQRQADIAAKAAQRQADIAAKAAQRQSTAASSATQGRAAGKFGLAYGINNFVGMGYNPVGMLGAGIGLLGGTAGSMLGGMAGNAVGDFVGDGISSAGRVQGAINRLSLAGHVTRSQAMQLYPMITSITGKTGVDQAQVAQGIASIASSGLSFEQTKQLASPVSSFADYVMAQSNGQTSYLDAAKMGIKFAHIFQAYTPEKIEKILPKIAEVAISNPDTLSDFLTQGRQYMTSFKSVGVRDEDTIAAGAYAAMLGFGKGRGGTGLQSMLKTSMGGQALTSHAQKHRMSALIDLGIINKDASFRFWKRNPDGTESVDLDAFVTQIAESRKKALENKTGTSYEKALQGYNSNLFNAFDTTGSRIASSITPDSIRTIENVSSRIRNAPSISDQQARVNDTYERQMQILQTNMEALKQSLFMPAIEPLTKGLHGLNDALMGLQTGHVVDSLEKGAYRLGYALSQVDWGGVLGSFADGVLSVGSALSGTIGGLTSGIFKGFQRNFDQEVLSSAYTSPGSIQGMNPFKNGWYAGTTESDNLIRFARQNHYHLDKNNNFQLDNGFTTMPVFGSNDSNRIINIVVNVKGISNVNDIRRAVHGGINSALPHSNLSAHVSRR